MEPISHFIGCVNELWKLLPVSLKYQDSGLHGRDFFWLCEIKLIHWVHFKVLKLPCILLSLNKSFLPCEYLFPNQRHCSYLLFAASYLYKERKKMKIKQNQTKQNQQENTQPYSFLISVVLAFPNWEEAAFSVSGDTSTRTVYFSKKLVLSNIKHTEKNSLNNSGGSLILKAKVSASHHFLYQHPSTFLRC